MIDSDVEFERTMAEYHRLAQAADGSPDAVRRDELHAVILEYQIRQGAELEKGRATDPDAAPAGDRAAVGQPAAG